MQVDSLIEAEKKKVEQASAAIAKAAEQAASAKAKLEAAKKLQEE